MKTVGDDIARKFALGVTFSAPRPPTPHPRRRQARVPRAPNSHELRELSQSSPVSRNPASSLGGTRGNSRIEGRPVRFPRPPSSPANLDREETRAGFPYRFPGFCRSRRTARRAGRAHRATLSVPVSSLDFRGERLRRRLPSGCSVYATVATHGRLRSARRPKNRDSALVQDLIGLGCGRIPINRYAMEVKRQLDVLDRNLAERRSTRERTAGDPWRNEARPRHVSVPRTGF